MKNLFHRFAKATADALGSPIVFIMALVTLLLWATAGPAADFSDTWQLVINTTSSIVTFLMVFIIQNTQNRDSKALHLKLDELLRAQKEASNMFINVEHLSDDELDRLEKRFEELRSKRKQQDVSAPEPSKK